MTAEKFLPKPFRPSSVNILGRKYTIEYVDTASEVDIYKRDSLYGQVCHWSGTIRILSSRDEGAVFETLVHEIMHAIYDGMQIEDTDEERAARVSTALADTLVRNEWIKI